MATATAARCGGVQSRARSSAPGLTELAVGREAELAPGFVRTFVDGAWSGTEMPAAEKEEAETPRC
jgi:hypothetical protein